MLLVKTMDITPDFTEKQQKQGSDDRLHEDRHADDETVRASDHRRRTRYRSVDLVEPDPHS
jgi:hypothetical protein